jgi:molybdopterin molybdotransferase
MIPVHAALAEVLAAAPQPVAVTVPLRDVLDCVLAEDVISDLDMPPFEKAMMDGFAVRAADSASPELLFHIAGTVAAGTIPDLRIASGQTARIMTGAPLPVGTDSVQMVEKTELVGPNKVRLLAPVRLGEHVAKTGEVIKNGHQVLTKGTYISPTVVGLLATVGCERCKVWRKPDIAILATGDELVEVGDKPGPGRIRNSNGHALFAQVLETGAHPVALGIAGDNKDSLTRMIASGLEYDYLLIAGGVSMGQFDLVEEILQELEVTIIFDSVDIKPGKPAVLGKKNSTVIFGLPGNPVSASTVFEVLVKPAILQQSGYKNTTGTRLRAELQKNFHNTSRRETYHPAITTLEQDRFRTTPIESKGSADVLAFARSNSFLVIREVKRVLVAGETVEVLLRNDFWRCPAEQ